MFLFARFYEVHLSTAGGAGAYRSANSKKQHLRDIAEVESDASAIRSAVLPDFVPDQVGFVLEPPSFQHLQTVSQKCVMNPKIKVAFRRGHFLNRKVTN